MRIPWSQRLVGIVLCVLAWAVSAPRAMAHEPFDVSTRVTIYPDRLELVSTLGTEGIRLLLSAAGRSPEDIAESLQSRGPDRPMIHPATLAPRFFQVTSNSGELNAATVRSVSEGAEILLTLIFPRPAAGTLEFRAVCYETIPGLRKGVLVVEDEIAGQLGAALLSATRARLVVTMPEPPAAQSGVSAVPPNAVNASDTANAANTATPSTAPSSEPPVTPSLGTYFELGVEHILIGIDHLLFLAVLLIGVTRLASMLGIITCFTLAHSVTLALAALEIVTISSRIIEPLIAASIIIVCVVNFARRHAEGDRVWLAGGFGLIHGFGFSSVLRDTGLGEGGGSIVMPLLSFNLGVEAGQLAVAAIFLPLLFLGRRHPGFVRHGLPAISAVVMVISGYWLVERIFF